MYFYLTFALAIFCNLSFIYWKATWICIHEYIAFQIFKKAEKITTKVVYFQLKLFNEAFDENDDKTPYIFGKPETETHVYNIPNHMDTETGEKLCWPYFLIRYTHIKIM